MNTRCGQPVMKTANIPICLMKNASSEIKLALIARLSNALVTEAQQKRAKVASLVADIQANAPVNIPITDEEIQEEINAVRHGQ